MVFTVTNVHFPLSDNTPSNVPTNANLAVSRRHVSDDTMPDQLPSTASGEAVQSHSGWIMIDGRWKQSCGVDLAGGNMSCNEPDSRNVNALGLIRAL